MLAGTIKNLALAVLAIALGCSVAEAQTLTASLQSDTAGLYAVIKEGVQTSYANGVIKEEKYIKQVIKEKRYLVNACDAPDVIGIGESSSKIQEKLILVASTVIRLSDELRKLGYPPEVWETLIRDFELHEIESIRVAATQHLTDEEVESSLVVASYEKLNKDLVAASARYRKSHPSLVRVGIDDGGCGVGEEVEVTIKTRPPGGSVYFITSFDYKVCKALNLDPDNRSSCNIWHEAVEGNPEHMLGDYEYVATWEGRVPKRSRLTINGSANANWRQTITITP